MNERIFLFEDNALTSDLFVKRLSEREYDVLAPKNPEEAVVLASQKPVHLILLDRAFEGFTTSELVRYFRQALPYAPVVVISDILQREEIQSVLDAGACDYWVKSDILREGISSHVESFFAAHPVGSETAGAANLSPEQKDAIIGSIEQEGERRKANLSESVKSYMLAREQNKRTRRCYACGQNNKQSATICELCGSALSL